MCATSSSTWAPSHRKRRAGPTSWTATGAGQAEGFDDARQALAHIAASITFLYLDGQFTALQDLGDRSRPDVREAPQIQVALDPRGQARPAIGAAA
ncbi:hypothetical protein [Diaphorobacter nitroreducens]|uniref:hypothetical protein n=1 Tax=Diaphorobacter nitroreducens TaxID=164759 RepID=UPI0024E2234A|nr:hypothetical protein [Diaphorobacter nitroreducens]